MDIPKELEAVLVSTPDTLSGAVRFVGTRVPVQALLDTLDDGGSLETFLAGFSSVKRDQALAVIHWQQATARRVLGLGIAS